MKPAAAILIGIGLLWVAGWFWLRARRRARLVLGEVESERRRAERAERMLKAGMVPYLARFLQEKLVVTLLGQRRELMQEQDEGTERARRLERRLASAQENLQQWLNDRGDKPGENAPLANPETTAAPRPSERPARSNPLRGRPPLPAPEPVEFREILARRGARALSKTAGRVEPTRPGVDDDQRAEGGSRAPSGAREPSGPSPGNCGRR